jgi:hypothetical protein
VHSGKALDCPGGLKSEADVKQQQPNDSPSQQWFYNPTTQEIKSTTQELVLDVFEERITPGTKVMAFPSHNGLNQKWMLIPV